MRKGISDMPFHYQRNVYADVDRNHVLQKTDRTCCCQFLNFAFSTFEVACSYISMDQMQEIWNVFFFHIFHDPGM